VNFSPASRKLLLGFLIASSLLLAFAILADWLPHLRGPAPETSEWYWPYLLRPIGQWWPSAVAALFTLAIAAWWINVENPRRTQTIAALIGLFAASLLLQAALIYADRVDIAAELIDRTLSNQASGFIEPAADIGDINQLLAAYPQAMPEFVSEHARTHPPGMILANWATIQAFSQFEWLAEPVATYVRPLRCMDLWLYNRPAAVSAALGAWSLIPLLFAALTVFPAYAVSRQLLNGYAVRLAAILAATLPALLLFAPKSVQIYAPLSLFMFWAFHTGLYRQSPWRLFVAGAIGSLLTFFSLGNAALFLLLMLYGLFIILVASQERKSETLWPQDLGIIIKHLLAFGAGAASLWLLYWLFWQVPPWEIAFAGLDQHFRLVTNIRRYEWWMVWNLIDLLLFSGWPLALGFLGSFLLIFRYWRSGQLGAVDALAIALGVLILLLNFSGSARGEVGRLWLFFMPLLAFPSAHFWKNALPGKRNAVVLVALQLLMVLCLGWAWRPVRAVIVVADAPPMSQTMPQTELNESFAGEPLKLVGFSLSSTTVSPGEKLELSLFWQAGGPASRPYTVFNHLLDETGQLVAQQDNWPVDGKWPPTCWRENKTIVDDYLLPIPASSEPGIYHLSSGLYDANNGLRVPLENGRDAVDLGTIEVEPR
jgi:hypothetical protein